MRWLKLDGMYKFVITSALLMFLLLTYSSSEFSITFVKKRNSLFDSVANVIDGVVGGYNNIRSIK